MPGGLILALLMGDRFAFAAEDHRFRTYSLVIERGDGQQAATIANFWPGEYPGPVIDVRATSGEGRRHRIRGVGSLRSPGATIGCTIPTGLYHPWAESLGGCVEFFSVHTPVSVRALKATVIDTGQGQSEGLVLREGECFDRVVYLSEGTCLATLRNTGRSYVLECGLLEDRSIFEEVPSKAIAYEQWLKLSCWEGHSAYVRDEDLLALPRVFEGQILDWGLVGPAEMP